MARPIRETPILFGEDARRFLEAMQNVKSDLLKFEPAFYEITNS